jgi:hypothetical protein
VASILVGLSRTFRAPRREIRALKPDRIPREARLMAYGHDNRARTDVHGPDPARCNSRQDGSGRVKGLYMKDGYVGMSTPRPP